jgi:hypothetical protein
MVRKLYRSSWVKYAQAIASALIASSCAVTYTDARYSPEQVNRQVVDVATGQGLGGAFVVFEWDRREVDIGHGARTFCVQVQTVRADAEGRYTMPTWEGRMGMIMSIYGRGYTRAHEPIAASKGIDMMKRGSEDFSQRLNELTRSLVQCTDEEDRKLLGLYEGIYEEARSAARTSQEKRTVDRHFLSPLDTARFGPEEARRRAHQREIQQ